MDMIKHPTPDDVKEVYLCPYSHTDFSWTNTRQWHIWRYIEGIRRALALMREDPDYTWTLDNVLHSFAPFAHYCPELLPEFIQRVREGRLCVVNGGMALARPVQIPAESFVRNMVEGKRYFCRTLGMAPEDMPFFFNADTAIGHTQLPQLLRLSGHRYYRANRPNHSMNEKGVPRQFRWKGLNGDEVLVARGEYGSFLNIDPYMDTDDMERDWERVRDGYWNEIRANCADNLTSDKLLLFAGCDDVMPTCSLFDKPLDQFGFIRTWNKKQNSHIAFSTPVRYFRALEKDWDTLPVWEGVLDNSELSYDASIKGCRSFWMMRKQLDVLLLRLEFICSLLETLGVPYPTADLNDIWLQQFEIIGHAIEWAIRQDDEFLWEKAQYARYKAKRMIRAAEDTLSTLVGPADGLGFVLINSTPQTRREPVLVHITSAAGVDGLELTDGQGRPVPFQVADIYTGDKNYPCGQNALDVLAYAEVPPMGYTVLRAKLIPGGSVPLIEREMTSNQPPLGTDEQPVTVDNGLFTATFVKGELVRVVGPGADMAGSIGTLMYTSVRPKSVSWDPSWLGQEESSYQPAQWSLVRSGPLQWIYRSRGMLRDHQAEMDITINKDSPVIDFSVRLNCVHDEGFFTCAFSCDADTPLTAGIPFGAEVRDLSCEPSTQRVPVPGDTAYFEGAWHGTFHARDFALFQKNGVPAALLPDNELTYYSLRRDLGRVSLLLNRQADLYEKSNERPLRWAKQAHPALSGDGVQTFRYGLYFPAGEKAPLTACALADRRFVNPVSCAPVLGFRPQGNAPQQLSLVRVEGDAVVSACYRDETGRLLRLYESEGRAQTLRVTVQGDWTQAVLTDLLGNEIAPVQAQDRTLLLPVKPWQIATIRLL